MIFDMTKRTGGGGGYVASDWLDPTKPTGELASNETVISTCMAERMGSFSLQLPNATTLPYRFCYKCTGLTSINAPNVETMTGEAFQNTTSLTGNIFMPKASLPTSCFSGSAIRCCVYKRTVNANSSVFRYCSHLVAVDQIGEGPLTGTNIFNQCSSLNAIILRSSTLIALGNVNSLGNTPFKSGGTGGTIYIPKSLYDHLGDGTADDYKSAANWSTYDGYGTITWAKIEGSYYETHYADGTLIS